MSVCLVYHRNLIRRIVRHDTRSCSGTEVRRPGQLTGAAQIWRKELRCSTPTLNPTCDPTRKPANFGTGTLALKIAPRQPQHIVRAVAI
jgi:hypothetical protein